MANQNSNVFQDLSSDSVLDPLDTTESDSMEQRVDEAEDDNDDSLKDPEGQLSNKFLTKTSQKLSVLTKLVTKLLDEDKIKQLQDSDPALAESLKKDNKFSHLFSVSEKADVAADPQDNALLMRALDDIKINGNKLPLSDIQKLQSNQAFMRTYSALVSGGTPVSEAVKISLSSTYPSAKIGKVPSVLNQASEAVPYQQALPKLTLDEKRLAKKFGISEEDMAKAKLEDNA